MTTPRVGTRTPRRIAILHDVVDPAPAAFERGDSSTPARLLDPRYVSAEELAKRSQQPVGVQLEVRPPLGDPALAVDQHHEAAVDDPLARDRVEGEGTDHAGHVIRGARQEVPGGEIDAVGVGVAAQHVGGIGDGIERDGDEAHPSVELFSPRPGLDPRELRGDQRTRLHAHRENEADDEDAAPETLGPHGRTGLVDELERRHFLALLPRAGEQEHGTEHGRQQLHATATIGAGTNPLARAKMASTTRAYPAGMTTGSMRPNHWIVVAEMPATASKMPKDPSPQCASEDTLAPRRPTTPAPPSEPTAPQRAAGPPMPR